MIEIRAAQRIPPHLFRPSVGERCVQCERSQVAERVSDGEFAAMRRIDTHDHLIADHPASLCWLGNQAAFEIHAWTSRLEDPSRPTFALIDIDPGTKTTWAETLVLARLYRTALGHLGEGRGVHTLLVEKRPGGGNEPLPLAAAY